MSLKLVDWGFEHLNVVGFSLLQLLQVTSTSPFYRGATWETRLARVAATNACLSNGKANKAGLSLANDMSCVMYFQSHTYLVFLCPILGVVASDKEAGGQFRQRAPHVVHNFHFGYSVNQHFRFNY